MQVAFLKALHIFTYKLLNISSTSFTGFRVCVCVINILLRSRRWLDSSGRNYLQDKTRQDGDIPPSSACGCCWSYRSSRFAWFVVIKHKPVKQDNVDLKAHEPDEIFCRLRYDDAWADCL